MKANRRKFNPPPGWPKPPIGWIPPADWSPDPKWPPAPEGWQLWIDESCSGQDASFASDHTQDKEIENGFSSSEKIVSSDPQRATKEYERANHILLDDDQVLQSVGIYNYHHPLETASAYRERLALLQASISRLVREKKAVERAEQFSFDNSLAKGQRMISDLSRLMLRAYNAEVENSIRTMRAGNSVIAKKRIENSRATIARLGTIMQLKVSDEFHALRIEEVELTADFLMKKREEKEAMRDERERLREVRRIEKEIAEQREKLDKERMQIEQVLSSLGDSAEGDENLRKRLGQIQDAIEENDYRAANVRAGYVYVISNTGAFGPNVVKIGLTRRLNPNDRIVELGDASVPFRFDVHALFFSEDAVTLEAELHKYFAHRRLNQTNYRKEFFFATPEEVRLALIEKVGNLLEYNDHAEATEYWQSVSTWPSGASYGRNCEIVIG